MKSTFSLIILVLFGFLAQAQTERCSSDQALQTLLANSPEVAAEFAEEQARIEQESNSAKISAVNGTFTIPVVVHVVYRTATQNISEAQIMSQLAVLNADFDKTNGDTTMIPAAFKPLLGDGEIEFCLAQQDPNGFLHSGITRTLTTVNSFSTDDKVKSNSTGGIDAWPRTKYLNIWVCNLGSGLLGYAYPPGAPANLDGVVIGYNYFGSDDYDDGSFVLSNTYNLGRTTTHEVGHWLNLAHVWGSGNGCQSDNVNDTPLQAGPNFGCPNFPSTSTCSGNANGPDGDMYMNYMDYVDDDCMHMFSVDQASRMQNALNIARSSILISTACTPGVIGLDEKETVSKLALYPNPSEGFTTIEMNLNRKTQVSIRVTDLLGQVVFSSLYLETNIGFFKHDLDLSSLPNGSYSIQIQAGNQYLNKALLIAR